MEAAHGRGGGRGNGEKTMSCPRKRARKNDKRGINLGEGEVT